MVVGVALVLGGGEVAKMVGIGEGSGKRIGTKVVGREDLRPSISLPQLILLTE